MCITNLLAVYTKRYLTDVFIFSLHFSHVNSVVVTYPALSILCISSIYLSYKTYFKCFLLAVGYAIFILVYFTASYLQTLSGFILTSPCNTPHLLFSCPIPLSTFARVIFNDLFQHNIENMRVLIT